MEFNGLCVGIITKPVGIKGQIKIHTFTESPNSFLGFKKFFLADKTELVFENPRIDGASDIVTYLSGCNDRNGAEVLRAKNIYVDKSDLPPLSDDEYYLKDIVGLSVLNDDGQTIGEVSDTFDFGAGVFLDIKLKDTNKIATVPFNKDSVLNIDLGSRTIMLNERFILR